ncbi:MAG: M50 family metallopeptidase [Ancrocorticia sp.]
MSWSNVWAGFLARLQNTFGAWEVPAEPWMWWAVIATVALLVATPAWAYIRQIVTVVHELGHAIVGVLCGRRFIGFVINRDMSGHTVTIGKSRGPGITLTTLAGYPMPALAGAAMVVAAMSGWAALVLLTGIVLLLAALIRARSGYTLVALTVLLIGSISLWWRENGLFSALIVLGVGMLLIIGAWRQLAAVIFRGGRGDDPAMLASLTSLPRSLWHLVLLILVTLPTWWAVNAILVR